MTYFNFKDISARLIATCAARDRGSETESSTVLQAAPNVRFGIKPRPRLPYNRRPSSAKRIPEEANKEGRAPCSCKPAAHCVRHDEKPCRDGE